MNMPIYKTDVIIDSEMLTESQLICIDQYNAMNPYEGSKNDQKCDFLMTLLWINYYKKSKAIAE